VDVIVRSHYQYYSCRKPLYRLTAVTLASAGAVTSYGERACALVSYEALPSSMQMRSEDEVLTSVVAGHAAGSWYRPSRLTHIAASAFRLYYDMIPLDCCRTGPHGTQLWKYLLLHSRYRSAKYCNQRVCVFVCLLVCLSVRSHISKTTHPNFTKFSECVIHAAVTRSSPDGYEKLCASGFVDDVVSYNGRNRQNQRRRVCFTQFDIWHQLSEIYRLWLQLVLHMMMENVVTYNITYSFNSQIDRLQLCYTE